jgi:hypothetical protein
MDLARLLRGLAAGVVGVPHPAMVGAALRAAPIREKTAD